MSAVTYKCPNCDGGLIFDPETQKFKCEYCLSTFTEEELLQQSSEVSPDFSGKTQEAVVYTCPNCGAEVVTDNTVAATFCYYCHNPVVLSGRLQGEYLPQYIVPFLIDKEEAIQKFMEWIHQKKFVSRNFFNKKQIEKVSGIYFPYWIYDCQTNAALKAHATKVRVWKTGDYEYTETQTYQIFRSGILRFSDLMKNALKKADLKLADGVLPFEMKKQKKFSMSYLSGFLAEKRDIEEKEIMPEIRQEIDQYAQSLLRETIHGYSTVTVESFQQNVDMEHLHYALFPVWILTYPGKNGKTYYYAMNGQTGKVCGVLPINWKKVLLVAGIIGIALFSLTLVIGGFL